MYRLHRGHFLYIDFKIQYFNKFKLNAGFYCISEFPVELQTF